MLVNIASKAIVIVLLDSLGQYTRIADAQRVKHWLETGESLAMAPVRIAHAVKVRATSRTRYRARVRHATFTPRLIKVSQKR